MNEDEKKFDALLQLLKLKRQETPPPGYFNSFSGQVISLIRSGEAAGVRTVAQPDSGTSWVLKFLQLFEFKPAFAGAFASALCLLMVFGIVYADRPDSGIQPFLQNADTSMGSFASVTPAAMPSANYAIGEVSSNYPSASLQPVPSLFGSENPLVQPVSFSPSSN
jgi:hypothetical protein